MWIEPYTGPWSQDHLKHLLLRTTYGVTPEKMAAFKGLSLAKVLDKLINKGTKPAPPVNYYESKVADPHGVKLGETWVNAEYGNGTVDFRRKQALRYWWIHNMRVQAPTIEERMLVFWHNHFATQLEIYNHAIFAYKYVEALRNHVLGNFKDMVFDITVSPAMLRYLNGHENTKSAPDENYARELQELFTVGKNPNGYNEKDVREAARVLTGHRYEFKTSRYFWAPNHHDEGDKQFSEFFGNKVIKGRSGTTGAEETKELIDMLLDKEETGQFLVRKMYRSFIQHTISEEAEENFIKPLGKLLKLSNFEVKPLIRAFFESTHFHDTSHRGAIIKSPLEMVVQSLQLFNPAHPTLEEDVYNHYSSTGVYMRVGEEAQQYIMDPPSVSGWPAYYQSPLFHKMWINSDTFQKRNEYLSKLINNKLIRNRFKLEVDFIQVAKRMRAPEDPSLLLEDLAFFILPIPVNKDYLELLKRETLLSGQTSDYYWTDLWNEYLANPGKNNTKQMVETRLRQVLDTLLQLPETQLS